MHVPALSSRRLRAATLALAGSAAMLVPAASADAAPLPAAAGLAYVHYTVAANEFSVVFTQEPLAIKGPLVLAGNLYDVKFTTGGFSCGGPCDPVQVDVTGKARSRPTLADPQPAWKGLTGTCALPLMYDLGVWDVGCSLQLGGAGWIAHVGLSVTREAYTIDDETGVNANCDFNGGDPFAVACLAADAGATVPSERTPYDGYYTQR
jgi:hypothetical protein